MKEHDTLQGGHLPTHSVPQDQVHVRRSFVAKVMLFLFGGGLLGHAVPSAAAKGKPMVTEEELEPFKKIAKEKGVNLKLLSGRKERIGKLSEMHLDMDMVRASLRNAIARAEKEGLTSIHAKLQRLLANGTAAQQVDFVLGSGNQYIFPEDVERLAAKAEKDKFHTFGVVCGTFCWLACICTGQFEQECRERCRDIICPES